MSRDSRELLSRRMAEAVERNAENQGELDRRRGRPPQPGDVFVLAEAAEWTGEWALIRQHQDDPRRWLVVPADTRPFTGSGDVKVPVDAPAGPLSLRCRFGVWLASEELESRMKRTAFLEPEHVEQARRKSAAIDEERLVGLPLEKEVDGSPEYQDWERVLSQARSVLQPAPVAVPEADRGAAGRERRVRGALLFPISSRWAAVRGPLGLAASILLIVGLGFSGGFLTQSFRIGGLKQTLERSDQAREELQAAAREQERQVEALEQAREDLRRRADALEEEKDRTEQNVAGLERDLRQARREAPEIDLPFVHFTRREPARGDQDPLVLPSRARRLAIILEVTEPDPFPRYRLQILERRTGTEIWRSDRLTKTANELSLDLPRSVFSNDDYLLRVYGLSGEGVKLLEEYALSIRLE